jgi:hypothetical protein
MMQERSKLISVKQETEDELVRTIIKLASGGALLIPGIITASSTRIPQGPAFVCIAVGSCFFIIALLAALAEQYLSSIAYDRQIETIVSYYQRQSALVSHEDSANKVRRTQQIAFALFITAVFVSSVGFFMASREISMSEKIPTPPPPPRPQPGRDPGHKVDVPGRSVPPPAPPPPPKKG